MGASTRFVKQSSSSILRLQHHIRILPSPAQNAAVWDEKKCFVMACSAPASERLFDSRVQCYNQMILAIRYKCTTPEAASPPQPTLEIYHIQIDLFEDMFLPFNHRLNLISKQISITNVLTTQRPPPMKNVHHVAFSTVVTYFFCG